MCRLVTISFLVLFVVIINPSNSLNLCEMPNFSSGECKLLEDCPLLYRHVQNKFTRPEVIEYIKRSECGFVDEKPKVCCPIRYDNRTKLSTETPVVSSTLLPSGNVCGRSPENKIVGGEVTNLDEFPWMALLDYEDELGTRSFKCGGALINDRYVLTAAHCLNPSLKSVRLGEWDISNEGRDCIGHGHVCADLPLNINIEKQIPFESYNFNKSIGYHDIALLRLEKKVQYSDYIKPICLPITLNETFNSHFEEKMTVAGWGRTETSPKSNKKLKVKVPVTNCTKLYDLYEYLDAGQMCAGGEKGKDSCKSDSGGPLMSLQLDAEKDAKWYAIGVLSFGDFPCGKRNKPAVYTKVSKYVYWIVDNLKP